MHRLGLILALAVTLALPADSAATEDRGLSRDRATELVIRRPWKSEASWSGDGNGGFDPTPAPVCRIDPNWHARVKDRTLDTNWQIEVPEDLDPAFEVHIPCIRGSSLDTGSPARRLAQRVSTRWP